MAKKYSIPQFLAGKIKEETYLRWLRRKAQAHLKRDRNRNNETATGEDYRHAIHEAVIQSDGKDHYTGQILDWSLISQYDNEASAAGRREYKAKFALLPTVDHIGDGTGAANFVICSWRINDMKNDMSHGELATSCILVLQQMGFSIQPPREPLDGAPDRTTSFAIEGWRAATDGQLPAHDSLLPKPCF
jgi:hypothetical protein